MNLAFSIDALSAAGDQAWRLQEHGGWRPCTYAEAMHPGDACIDDRQIAEDWAGRRLAKDKSHGLVRKEKPGMFDFLARGIFAHAVLHRFSSAPVPDRSQMLTTLRDMAPGTPWLMYLDVAGHFRALDTSCNKIIGNLAIAVRGEIASSPDYVGPKAAEDEKLTNELWRQFLAGWLEHLTTSKMAVFVPDPEKLKEEEAYLDAIRNWQHE